MKALWVDRRGKFISIKLKKFCDKKRIVIKYIIPYLQKKNSLAKRG